MNESASSSSSGSKDTVGRGVALWVLLLLASQVPSFLALAEIDIFGHLYTGDGDFLVPLFWLIFFSVTQLVTVVPATVVLLVRKRRAMLKGVLLSSGVAFLLNSLCTAAFFAWESTLY